MSYRILFCCVFSLLVLNAISQKRAGENSRNYHLIYLDISQSKSRQNQTLAIMALLDNILKNGDNFLLYFSNGYSPEVLTSDKEITQADKDHLITLLQTVNTGPPILMFDKDSILDIWDKSDIIRITPDDRVELAYSSISLHYFISPDLFKLDEEELVDRLLLVKDLTSKHIDPQKINVDFFFSKDEEKAFADREKQLLTANLTGYKYFFNRY